MKLNNIIIPLAAASLLLTGCYDEKMDWHTPEGHNAVVSSEIPLALAEEIANYDSIKAYMNQYMPGVPLGIGLGADKYLNDATYSALCNSNFQQFVTGNAMKHASVVKNDGSLDFTTINQFMTNVPDGIEVYGHNFIWHTQQNQTYLKSLIAPTMKVESDGDIENVLKNGDFETGDLTGWMGWGNSSTRTCTSGVGIDNSYAVVIVNPKDASTYSAQFCQDLSSPLVVGKTYVIRFKAKSSVAAGQIQFCAQQPSGSYPAEGYNTFNVGTDWTTCQYEFTVASHDALTRICLNVGAVAATYTIDNVEFGLKVEDPMDNVLTGDNSDFEGGTRGSWGSWGNSSTGGVSDEGGGYNGSKYCMTLTNPTDANQWSAQCAYTFNTPFVNGKTYVLQFYAKSSLAGVPLQFQVQNGSTYGSQEGYNTFTLGTTWTKYEYEYTCGKDDANRILLNFGKNAATYYIDNIKFGLKKSTAAAKSKSSSITSTKVTYTFKTAAEKKAALLGAMESWIKGMMTNLSSSTATHCIKQWDVINEPITDDTYKWRGVDGNFSDDDTAPTEDQTNGLTMDWASGHWYWGYYIGKEYAADAFIYARKYAPSDCKLYVNDYNLETSPGKLAALIDFVKYIDENGGKVDGIGTQMHVSSSIDSASVATMFQTMAATGKLVRISELDVQVGTTTPSAGQQQTQSDVYQMIIKSYKANVPTAQQGGITIWGVSDATDEHTYWLPKDAPNIFDANYARKIAYKGVCDGIAGKDIGAGFSGDLWVNYYK
jgi:GH35 family endo-1,4-beta-xylanase